ncbi:centrosomal protein of 78 kDa-like isoform X2 [Biomphalaria glabrata]|uniref:Centrosomal protein of 78 kDa-like isoform X2 n=1 Tax=Biomphalaria glabrata TaxID=6526 RepID=A0A9W2ZCB7_BIOGL|nr:centrosomal protein of 78 kDa-like isoform X2 [Biomphalaria glabrata]
MIESVQARQRGAFNFADHYDNLCALQDSVPLPSVKAHLGQGVVDINGDRVRLTDWQPIINTIKINKSLQFIAVRSYYQHPTEDEAKKTPIMKRKLPSIRSKEITHRLVKALKECLFVSPTLTCIELQGLALRERDIQVFVKGLLKSTVLRHVSLEYCRIGDLGLEVLCKGLKNTKNINSVNLTGCSLSSRGAELLAAVIKHQGMQRHNEAWRDSLRYRRPDLDRMSGIRRITANNNPMLGDDGAKVLAEALKDDLWLKALDLQSCGIGATGAKSFLDVLRYNTTIVVLDLRMNPLINRELLHSVMEQLMLNCKGEDSEYKWIKVEELEDQTAKLAVKTRRRATKVLNSSLGKKTTIKVTPTSAKRKGKARCVSRKLDVEPSPGLPWRTAARANRFRGHPPDTSKFLTQPSPDVSTSLLFNPPDKSNESRTSIAASANPSAEAGLSSSRSRLIEAAAAEAMKKLEDSHLSLDLTNEKEVLIELEQMRRHLKEERTARAKADQRVLQLMLENRRLHETIEVLEKCQQPSHRLLEDESFLESIETSFKQFHGFIDMLKEAGLGQLVTMAGLDQSKMPFSQSQKTVDPVLKQYSNGKISSPPYANLPAGSSEARHYQKPNGHSVQMSRDIPKDPTMQSSIYVDESELARQEADELYSRLVKETRGVLNQDSQASVWTKPGDITKSGKITEGVDKFSSNPTHFMDDSQVIAADDSLLQVDPEGGAQILESSALEYQAESESDQQEQDSEDNPDESNDDF